MFEGSEGDAVNFAQDMQKGDTRATLQSAGFERGDLVLMRSSANYSTGVSDTGYRQGWMATVVAVDGSGIVLNGGAFANLQVVDFAKAVKIKPITLVWHGGKIVSNGGVHTGIRIKNAINSVINNVSINGCDDAGIALIQCYNAKIYGADIRNAVSSSAGNTGYGIAVYNASTNITVDKNYIEYCRHAIAGGGVMPVRNVVFSNNHVYDCGIGTDAVDCHEPTEYWSFVRNFIVTGARGLGGIVIRGSHIDVTDNVIDRGGKLLIKSFVPDTNGQQGIKIRGNRLVSTRQGIVLDATTTKIVGAVVEQNTLDNVWFYGILMTGNGISDIVVNGNNINGVLADEVSNGRGIDVRQAAGPVIIANNTIKAAVSHAIFADNAAGITIKNNDIKDSATSASVLSMFRLNNCNNCKIEGNTGVAARKTAIYVSGDNISISHNNMSIDSDTADFVRAAGAGVKRGLAVINNLAAGIYRHAVYSSGYDDVVITNNVMRGAVNSQKILMQDSSRTLASGNILD